MSVNKKIIFFVKLKIKNNVKYKIINKMWKKFDIIFKLHFENMKYKGLMRYKSWTNNIHYDVPQLSIVENCYYEFEAKLNNFKIISYEIIFTTQTSHKCFHLALMGDDRSLQQTRILKSSPIAYTIIDWKNIIWFLYEKIKIGNKWESRTFPI